MTPGFGVRGSLDLRGGRASEHGTRIRVPAGDAAASLVGHHRLGTTDAAAVESAAAAFLATVVRLSRLRVDAVVRADAVDEAVRAVVVGTSPATRASVARLWPRWRRRRGAAR